MPRPDISFELSWFIAKAVTETAEVAALRGVGSDAHVSLDSSGRVLGLYGHSAREEASDASATDATVSEAASDEKRNVHLPRQKLRQSLLDALESGTVKWGKRLERYEESGVRRRHD